jgi:pimeloyl-ACP methyl ester carboxylesterase
MVSGKALRSEATTGGPMVRFGTKCPSMMSTCSVPPPSSACLACAAKFPKWQAWMQKTQPKLLVVWGKHDLSFDPGEPERYRKDVPGAHVHVLDAGHFALDAKADEIAALVREFMK